MTKKNRFFSVEQEKLSNEFFRECPSKKIALENMLENFGYEYEYSKMAVCIGVVCVVKIYIGLSFLGTFFMKIYLIVSGYQKVLILCLKISGG